MKPIYRCPVCGAFTECEFHCNTKTKLLMSGFQRLSLSKLISYILRHSPEDVGLVLDAKGWVRIDELVQGIRCRWRNKEKYQWVTREHIIALATLDPKGRFELRDDMIRARYGHNRRLRISIDYEIDPNSRVLYHGTTASNLNKIMGEGIKPMKRHYVHIAMSLEDACITGSRHGRNIVALVIDVDCLRNLGYEVLVASHSVRLVKYVPPQCISKVIRCS